MLNKLKQTALSGVLLSSFAISASAMEQMQDDQLAEVTGQDGLSVVAVLNLNIDSVEYGDATKGTSMSFGNINVTGLGGFMLDVITGADFIDQALGALGNFGVDPAAVAPLFAEMGLQAGYQLGSDVIQISGPNVDPTQYPDFSKLALNVSVDTISTGNGGHSMGSLAVRGFNPVGSTVWMFGHE